MTHLLNDDDPKGLNVPKYIIRPNHSTSLLQDLLENFAHVWVQTIRPAWSAFQAAVIMALVKGQLQIKARYKAKTQAPAVSLGISARSFAETIGLSTESTMTLRRIQGSLSDNWSAAVSDAQTLYRGKSNRWAQAGRKTAPIGIGKISMQENRGARSNSGNAPAAHEEIRGLDDIFTGPVTGLFSDEIAGPAPVQKPKLQRDAVEKVMTSKTATNTQKAQPIITRFDESILKKVRWPDNTLPLKVTVAAFRASENDNRDSFSHEGYMDEPADDQLYSEAENNTEWFSMLEEPEAPSIQPKAANGSGDDKPRQPVEDVPPAPVKPVVVPIRPVEQKTVEESLPKPASVVPIKPEKVIPEPVVPDYSRASFPVYQPLEEEESGFDMMVRNNRILSNSITNLVDTYFRNAAQEDEPNYY